MQVKTDKFTRIALETRDKILTEFTDVLNHPSRENYLTLLQGMTANTHPK
jgi:AccI restriction endonuclease